jgi:hypothetical protein
MKHDGLVSLFQRRPELAPELLQGPLGLKLPAWTEAKVEPSEFTQLVPTEYRADAVVLLQADKPVLAVVVEVQLSRDDDKHESWPVYLISLRAPALPLRAAGGGTGPRHCPVVRSAH